MRIIIIIIIIPLYADPQHHGAEEIPPPPPKKSCMDRTRNAIARTAAQIRTGHRRSAVYLKRIKKRGDDRCWFCVHCAFRENYKATTWV